MAEDDSRTSAQQAPTVVGRTSADATVDIAREVLRLLGRAAPTVIFLAAVVFAVYKFTELQEDKLNAVRDARLEAQRQNLEEVTQLKTAILSDATSLTQLQQSNVQVMKAQLEQHQAVMQAIGENQVRVAELTQEKAEVAATLEAQAAALAERETALKDYERRLAAQAEQEAALLARVTQLEETTLVADQLVAVLNSALPLVPSREPAQIAERYEGQVPDHIGRDFAGNYYYGTFRIRGGREMEPFLAFLAAEAPNLGKPLTAVGGAEAAGAGTAMFQQTWRRLARDPAFETAQRRYIHANDYRQTGKLCKFNGKLDLATRSVAVQSVLWAMAVQHGSTDAGRLCAAAAAEARDQDDAALIDALYRLRSAWKQDLFPDQDGVIYRLLDIRYDLERNDARKILDKFPAGPAESQ